MGQDFLDRHCIIVIVYFQHGNDINVEKYLQYRADRCDHVALEAPK